MGHDQGRRHFDGSEHAGRLGGIRGLAERRVSTLPVLWKIGSWRYDDAGALVKEKDEDGWVLSTTQLRVCRKCKRVVLEKWSDCESRSFERHPGGTNTEPGAAPESGPATS